MHLLSSRDGRRPARGPTLPCNSIKMGAPWAPPMPFGSGDSGDDCGASRPQLLSMVRSRLAAIGVDFPKQQMTDALPLPGPFAGATH